MDRFFIAPYDSKSGLDESVKPWLIPDNAFQLIENAYVWRGRVRKRFGSRWFGNDQSSSRLRVAVGTVGANGTVPGASGVIGQMFSIVDLMSNVQYFTVYQASGPMYTTSAATGTFDTTNGNFTFANLVNFMAGTTIYWYPALPVMGFVTYETTLAGTNNPTIAFDTRYAYQFVNNGWERLQMGASTWSGSDSQFFWGTSYVGLVPSDQFLFVTNYNQTEVSGMRYLDTTLTWNAFYPAVDATNFLWSARILIPFKNGLLACDTWEGPAAGGGGPGALINYKNRVRWCGIGLSPLGIDAWREDIAGNGNKLDCPSVQRIKSVEFLKDRLIVFLDESSWEFVYNNNVVNPFKWQQINPELGVVSTFSVIPFDKVAMGLGNLGILACNGANTQRIDEKIPDQIFTIQNLFAGRERVYGIREYASEMVYWTFPDITRTADDYWPNKIMAYNYKNGTWSFNDDSITAFGYMQITTPGDDNDVTWDSTTVTWDDDISWGDGQLESQFPNVVAGNQQGFVYIVAPDEVTNTPAFQITDLSVAAGILTFTAINHNINGGDFLFLQGITGTLTLPSLNGTIVKVLSINITTNTFQAQAPEALLSVAGDYSGGGVYAFVSPVQLVTKQYNFYAQQGQKAAIQKVEFLVDTEQSPTDTDIGTATQVDFYVSSTRNSGVNGGALTGSLLGTGTLDLYPYTNTLPPETGQDRVWHPVFMQANGQVIQFSIAPNDTQMLSPNVRNSGFELHAICISARPSSSRLS